MMDITKTNKRNLLEIYNVIVTKGTKIEEIYQFNGIQASQDFDGYSCWLSYKDLTVSILFHGKYDFDYKDKDTLKSFFKKITTLLTDK